MAFNFTVPSLGNKYIDYRQPIPGNSFTWSWIRPLSQVKYLVIHHTAGPDTQTPDEIARYHIQSNGWGGVGYHFIISKNGTTYYVGDLSTARAHVKNYNHLALGICLVGTFMNGKKPTTEQLNSAHELCFRLLFQTPELINANGWEDLVGHQQLQATACPGDTWNSYRQQIIIVPGTSGSGGSSGGSSSSSTGGSSSGGSSVGGSGGSVGSSARRQEINKIYQVVLGREADQSGLNYHDQSAKSIDEIRKIITESEEHQNLIKKAHNLTKAQQLAQESLPLIADTYWKVDEISKKGDDQSKKTAQEALGKLTQSYWKNDEISKLGK